MNTEIQMPTLAARAQLVYVRFSQWSARKLDKRQTKKVTDDANASADAARVSKHLLASADEKLRAIDAKAKEMRAFIDHHTLPWDDAGNRLLSNVVALQVLPRIEELKDEFYAAVDEFINDYPALRAQALHALGDMADPAEYPKPDEIRHRFSVRITFSPVPEKFSDVRVGLSQEQAALWQSHYEGRVREQANEALLAAFGRLREQLEKYAERLQLRDDALPGEAPKVRVFRDSMVENMRDTVNILAELNVFNDPRLSQMVDEVRSTIANFDAADLRNPVLATSVRSDVVEVLERMKAFNL